MLEKAIKLNDFAIDIMKHQQACEPASPYLDSLIKQNGFQVIRLA